MKFKLPNTIEIGPMTIAVERADLVGEDEYGEFRYDTATIKIDKRCGVDQALETYWHEVIEAANMIGELKLPHYKIQLLGALLAQSIKTAR